MLYSAVNTYSALDCIFTLDSEMVALVGLAFNVRSQAGIGATVRQL